jgi:hypothetical protein
MKYCTVTAEDLKRKRLAKLQQQKDFYNKNKEKMRKYKLDRYYAMKEKKKQEEKQLKALQQQQQIDINQSLLQIPTPS